MYRWARVLVTKFHHTVCMYVCTYVRMYVCYLVILHTVFVLVVIL